MDDGRLSMVAPYRSAGVGSIAAQDAVAGNGELERILCTGASYGPYGVWRPDSGGNFGEACDCGERDFQHFLPHTAAEHGTADISTWTLNKIPDGLH
jgi:hypothetical protein